MRRRADISALVPIAIIAAIHPAAVSAQEAAYIWFSDIKGDSDNPQYPEWTELTEFSLQLSAPAGTAPIVRPLVVKFTSNTASVPLYKKLLTAETIPEAIVAVTRDIGGLVSEYRRIELNDVKVVNASPAQSGVAVGGEVFALDFSRICLSYEDENGELSVCRNDQIQDGLDVDGNGLTNALTDGLLIIRYLFGFQGAALTDGAVGSGCTRCTAEEISAYCATLVP
jgi:type VI protein secretion system component Hcp